MRQRIFAAASWFPQVFVAAAVVLAALCPHLLPSGGFFEALAFSLSVLPFHAAIGLGVWALLCAAVRRRRAAGVSLVLAAALLLLAAGPLGGGVAASPVGPTLRVMTANLRYDHADPAAVLAAVDAADPGVLLTQEWSLLHEAALSAPLAERFPHRRVSADVGQTTHGSAVFSRWPLEEVPLGEAEAQPLNARERDRIQRVRLLAPDREVLILNVHPASPQSVRAIVSNTRTQRAIARLAAAEPGPVVVAGDFNAPPLSAGVRGYAAVGLIDAHAAAGSGLGHTWPARGLPRFVPGVRIDAVKSGGGLVPVSCELGRPTGSDHRPVVAELRFTDAARGP